MRYSARPEYCVSNRAKIQDRGELLISGPEARNEMGARFGDARYLSLIGSDSVHVDFGTHSVSIGALADRDEVIDKIGLKEHRSILVDLTLISPTCWAPLVRHLLSLGIVIRAIYSEPSSYKLRLSGDSLRDDSSDHDVKNFEFSISKSTKGNRPIPTFASLLHTERNQKLPLVVLLGFEGWRVPRLLDDLEFTVDPLIPIVGCPGYKIDYPGFSVSANQFCLSNPRWLTHMRLASACSPFAVIDSLACIARDRERMCIAPLGTTPMLLGSVLYVIDHPESALVYDHPDRVHDELEERGRTWVYDLSSFGKST